MAVRHIATSSSDASRSDAPGTANPRKVTSRHEPELAIPLVEELLRYEPPVQINPKYMALDDVQVGDVTIPKGSRIVLALAAANRDPNRFPDPDRFDPRRSEGGPLSFGGGGRTTSTSASSPVSTTASAPGSPAKRRRSR